MKALRLALTATLRSVCLSRANLALEDIALRQQLTIYQRDQGYPRLRFGDRVFWIQPRRLWSGWTRALIVVRPETVITWLR
jgi:hypothetical protein